MPAAHGERVVKNALGEAFSRLTVLTPFYRYDPTPLIERLAASHVSEVEMVLLDDGSGSAELTARALKATEKLPFPARVVIWEKNRGRSAARNRLITEARGQYVLFLDADMIPDAPDFLARWLDCIALEQPAAAFGGLSLRHAPHDTETALHRFMFGRSDCRSAADRARDAAQFTATSNLLARRDVLAATPFDDKFTGWGWEDVDWALRAAQRGPILHIDNPATHAGLDTVEQLLRKFREAGPNFARLLSKHPEAARFRSHRAARALKHVPARGKLQEALAWLARDPMGASPMLVRHAALKLYRASVYAEHLP